MVVAGSLEGEQRHENLRCRIGTSSLPLEVFAKVSLDVRAKAIASVTDFIEGIPWSHATVTGRVRAGELYLEFAINIR